MLRKFYTFNQSTIFPAKYVVYRGTSGSKEYSHPTYLKNSDGFMARGEREELGKHIDSSSKSTFISTTFYEHVAVRFAGYMNMTMNGYVHQIQRGGMTYIRVGESCSFLPTTPQQELVIGSEYELAVIKKIKYEDIIASRQTVGMPGCGIPFKAFIGERIINEEFVYKNYDCQIYFLSEEERKWVPKKIIPNGHKLLTYHEANKIIETIGVEAKQYQLNNMINNMDDTSLYFKYGPTILDVPTEKLVPALCDKYNEKMRASNVTKKIYTSYAKVGGLFAKKQGTEKINGEHPVPTLTK